jgi:hypothetical protein
MTIITTSIGIHTTSNTGWQVLHMLCLQLHQLEQQDKQCYLSHEVRLADTVLPVQTMQCCPPMLAPRPLHPS